MNDKINVAVCEKCAEISKLTITNVPLMRFVVKYD